MFVEIYSTSIIFCIKVSPAFMLLQGPGASRDVLGAIWSLLGSPWNVLRGSRGPLGATLVSLPLAPALEQCAWSLAYRPFAFLSQLQSHSRSGILCKSGEGSRISGPKRFQTTSTRGKEGVLLLVSTSLFPRPWSSCPPSISFFHSFSLLNFTQLHTTHLHSS